MIGLYLTFATHWLLAAENISCYTGDTAENQTIQSNESLYGLNSTDSEIICVDPNDVQIIKNVYLKVQDEYYPIQRKFNQSER